MKDWGESKLNQCRAFSLPLTGRSSSRHLLVMVVVIVVVVTSERERENESSVVRCAHSAER